jgi:two-component system sensor histidine kinase MtrB
VTAGSSSGPGHEGVRLGLRLRMVLALVLVASATGAAAVVLGVLAFERYRTARLYQGDYLLGDLYQLLGVTVLGLLALVLLLALVASAGVLRPVRRLVTATEQMAGGQLDVRVPVHGGDEVAQLTRSFNRMAESLARSVDDLQRAEARSRRFAADVAHELRTPLAAMAAVTEVLDDETAALSDRGAEAARLVVRETQHLASLVDDLSEMARFDASTAALRRAPVDVVVAVRRCLEMRGWAGQVEVDVDAAVQHSPVVALDPGRFEVVLANLVGTAVRHGAPPVTVALRTLAGRLVVEVADRGPGLAPDVLPHVFERFFKADTARGRSDGSGLGLALALENARLHGGTIRAAARPGGGALFTLDLPLVTRP